MANEGTSEPSALDAELRRRFDAQRDERIFIELGWALPGEIAATAASAIEHATRPDRLRFGIFVRQGSHDGGALRERRNDPRFSIETAPTTTQPGRQWAKHRAQSFYDGEPFVLQIDGDARFAPDWDIRYPELLAAADVERPLLTDAPLPPQRHGPSRRPPLATEPSRLAHHRFTVGRFCIDVPHDPDDRGHDDIRLAVRAYTHGYASALPSAPLVVRTGNAAAPDAIDRCTVASVADGLVRAPIGGIYGIGRQRTVAAFARLTLATCPGTDLLRSESGLC